MGRECVGVGSPDPRSFHDGESPNELGFPASPLSHTHFLAITTIRRLSIPSSLPSRPP